MGDPLALLVTVTLPERFPLVEGLKVTPKTSCCPAVSVTGVPALLKLNPVPLSVICEIVTLAFPELVIVMFLVEDEPAFTLPNERLELLNVKVLVAATPVPLKDIDVGDVGALLTTVTAPVESPAEEGENCTLKLLVCPALILNGRASVPVLNPLPDTLTWLIVSVPVPLFFNWML